MGRNDNVPDDWGTYWNTCEPCGERWHASEGGHDCPFSGEELAVQGCGDLLAPWRGCQTVAVSVLWKHGFDSRH